MNTEPSLLLDDQAIFIRTSAGQRALTDVHGQLTRLERRFLGAVTGHTSLRVLMDLGLDHPYMADAVISLVGREFVRLVSRETDLYPDMP